jgi:ubiquinol-cytochrome c reductase cytochrome c1 subunit
MKYWHKITAASFVAIMACATPQVAQAASAGEAPPEVAWSFNGPFGTYDKASLQRGLKVYREVCAACHGMKYLHYRDFAALGYDESQVKAIAAEYTIEAGPNDEGDMFERPGIPADRLKAPYPNKKAAMYANNGAYPPDMSLLVKARTGGADYIHALMIGYQEAPADVELMQGQHWNKYMPGHIISMAPPLQDDMIAYEDGTPTTVDQYAKDVSQFLQWASDPYMEKRKKIGTMALLFLAVFAGVAYAVKRKIWSSQH